MSADNSEVIAINTNVRLFDLVRYMRSELHQQDLITDEEYTWLCSECEMANSRDGGSPSPRRLEDYNELMTQLADARRELEELRHFHDGSVTEAYRLLGIENDGELRMKWVLLEIAKLKRELEGAREDGARLDWLENNKQSGGGAFRLQWSFRDDNNQKSLRSAIDSARAAETGREGT